MNKRFLFTWHAPAHHAQRVLPAGVMEVSAFSRPTEEGGLEGSMCVWVWAARGKGKRKGVGGAMFRPASQPGSAQWCKG